MDPKKAAAEWFRTTVFREEAIRPRAPRSADRLPPVLRAARSLENGIHQTWQSRETVFLKQGKLLANYEDDHDYSGSVTCYYPTYQSLTDRQLRGYFSWRTKVRGGDVCKTCLSFAFLYIYELINQIGVAGPMEGYHKLIEFRDAYGRLDSGILSYLRQWLTDYVVYYGLDPTLLDGTSQAALDRCAAVLEQVRTRDAAEITGAVEQASKWLKRSKFYAEHREDMGAVIVQVLRRMSDHYAARCKRTMVEQYFGVYGQTPVCLFDTAVFCDPLKRKDYEYALDGQCVYFCKGGRWSVRKRDASMNAAGKLDALLKTVDSIMRREFDTRHPVKPELNTMWVLRLIEEEVQGLLARKRAAEEKKIAIDPGRLAKIRQDAAITREKLIVEEDVEPPEEPTPLEPRRDQEPEPPRTSLVGPPAGDGEALLAPGEYRLLQCLLYGGDTGWMREEGQMLSVLVDGINEKLYDVFLDCVLDDTPQLIQDYIDDLKEMVHP